MGRSLDFRELRAANVVRCESAFTRIVTSVDDWSATDWACAAAGEMGEACNLIVKLHRGDEVPIEEIGHEIADTVIYLDLLAHRLGIDLSDAVRLKFNIVSARVGSDVVL